MSLLLQGLKIALLVANGFEQSEMVDPKKALEDAGARVDIVSLEKGTVRGWDWIIMQPVDEFRVDITVSETDATQYDGLLLPGGLNSPDDLRLDEKAVAFVKGFAQKPIASICHGQWVLINADLVRSKKLTSWPSIRIDLVNAGAQWVDQEVVRDGNLVTSRMPSDVPAFTQAMIKLFSEIAPKK